MRRLAPIVVLLFAVVAFGLLAVQVARAAPRAASDACTWQTNGETVTIDGVEYLCLCERVAAIDEIWCTWIRSTPEIRKARRAHRAVKRPAKLVVRLALRPVTR